MTRKKEKSDPNYSMIAMGTMNSENVPDASNTGSKIKKGKDVKKGEGIERSNKLIYLVAMFVSVVMLVAIVGCFIALFLEVAKLKKTLTEQTPIIMHHLQQINVSIEDRYEDFTDIQDSRVQQLNASV